MLSLEIKQITLLDVKKCSAHQLDLRSLSTFITTQLQFPCLPSLWQDMMTSSNGYTFSALLAFCAGNSPVPGEFPAQRPVTRSFDVSLICVGINGGVNNREAGDLRRYPAHSDVTVMNTPLFKLYCIVLSFHSHCEHRALFKFEDPHNENDPAISTWITVLQMGPTTSPQYDLQNMCSPHN